ncbi:unnamed protein product, partial [Litomosoides sigmodontis]
DSVGGGAWPFLVGGAICLVNSDNERDSSLLNRSVMPLDVLGRTRATLKESACFTLPVRKDRVTAEPPSWLGLGTAMIPMNQESLVGAGH